MAKYYGNVGFALLKETRPGIWEEVYEERQYKGDLTRRRQNWVNSQNLNDNLEISNEISILGDTFLFHNFSAIRYVVWDNVAYEVNAAIIDRPRLVLSIGGVFHVPEGGVTP